MEIERKFLINPADINFDISLYPHKRYVQAYISTDPVIRLRDEGGEYVLCIKGSGNLVREEFELIITKEQFNSLMKKTEPGAIFKTRYFIQLEAGYTAELDIYEENLLGFSTVEVEFASVKDAESFTPPSFFGKDVTDDARYKNANLLVDGPPREEP